MSTHGKYTPINHKLHMEENKNVIISSYLTIICRRLFGVRSIEDKDGKIASRPNSGRCNQKDQTDGLSGHGPIYFFNIVHHLCNYANGRRIITPVIKTMETTTERKIMQSTEAMKEMIQREIQSISSLEERVVFKDLMEGVFLSLYEANESMYRQLEGRIMDELAYDINRYLIRTGIVERPYFDKSHHQMSAMQEADLETSARLAGDIREKIEQDGKFPMASVFLKCDSMTVSKILKPGRTFNAVIEADGRYPVTVEAERSMRYLGLIEQLYHLFMKNGIPWITVNAPYLFKMADLYITELPEELPDSAEVTSLRTDFGEYNDFVHYDMVPIWNVGRLRLESVGFPVACGDHRNYEHVVSIGDYGEENAYLVSEEAGIQNVRQAGEQLFITGEMKKAKKWDIYVIRSGSDRRIDRNKFPIMENMRKDTFSERFKKKAGQPIKTRGELERFIRGFGLEDYIVYTDCILEGKAVTPETYSMNFFMEDEIRDNESQKQLILLFTPVGSEKWILRDLASFIASEVQELFPEYQCGGRLI